MEDITYKNVHILLCQSLFFYQDPGIKDTDDESNLKQFPYVTCKNTKDNDSKELGFFIQFAE